MAQVTDADRVYDLGAGDGKIAIAAARDFGAQAVGVEYDPQLARLAQCYVQADKLGERVRIVQGDIFETDFSTATVVTLYLLPELNLRLRPTHPEHEARHARGLALVSAWTIGSRTSAR